MIAVAPFVAILARENSISGRSRNEFKGVEMTDQKPKMIYNNPRFQVKQYDFDLFVGPAAGEKFKDFTLSDLETGEAVKLSDFAGKWVVFETGSSTCSMYTKNILEMGAVAKNFPDVEFLLVYVREAHPGERLHQHKNYDEKVRAAKLLKPRYGENRRVLVDTYEGEFHRAYGAMPNILYVIRPDGTIHYRCNWATVDSLREALQRRDELHTVENADMHSLKTSRGLYITIRTMWTGGALALYDFVKAGPQMEIRHKEVDDHYKKYGKFRNQVDAPPLDASVEQNDEKPFAAAE